ncbi:DUF1848 domain-containing protein [Catenisphaera adipataccumulans]|uniref:DNA repair photolyase n=1 Tax=Catenisphaera adipataccumulans TaxID=700500 RepID=A0A7W8FUR7_9FIRM|nr:DUF1848 domain-containing protein [Catenisphaera adipataccumulans]MBB5182844.1 DNA repair photolyase [Catenisphaera adipataccumulans]
MILNTGNRTDIPAFYHQWWYNRLDEGFVCARNPFQPHQIYQYTLDPDTIDVICYCTKDPGPMVRDWKEIPFAQYWQVTITPYGKDVEPFVPNKRQILADFRSLSEKLGPQAVTWRYDPILLTDRYTIDFHIRSFEAMAKVLEHYTDTVVISFLDLYQKTKRNFPEGREVTPAEQVQLAIALKEIADRHQMHIEACMEDHGLEAYGIDTKGCLRKEVLERVIGKNLIVPHLTFSRDCACLLQNDIGVYNTCKHGCRYCYANTDRKSVMQNAARHDPNGPLLIGRITAADQVRQVQQKSYIDRQVRLF